LQGYLSALAEAGITPNDALIVPAGFQVRDGYEAMLRILYLPKDQYPTAVFAANDTCAQGALNALQEYGLRVPREVALIGFDDSPLAEALHPTLTSVRMPVEEIGALATQMLVKLVQGEEVEQKQPVLPVQLVIRESTGMQNSQ
jgi:DNA-binding LacI/PurR family transcriptional regulator